MNSRHRLENNLQPYRAPIEINSAVLELKFIPKFLPWTNQAMGLCKVFKSAFVSATFAKTSPIPVHPARIPLARSHSNILKSLERDVK